MTYTEEDFARAKLATRGDLGVARRSDDPLDERPWWTLTSKGVAVWRSGAVMAAGGWVPVVEAGTITLDGLSAAWEAAEVPTDDNPVRPGDVVIMKHSEGFNAFRAANGPHEYLFGSGARVLSRAPRREPWADLADVLGEMTFIGTDESAEALARMLHVEYGVRVTDRRGRDA